MSDTRHDAHTPPAPQPAAPESNGAGALLRRSREQARLDVGALSAMLKVPRERIEALEAGRFDELPDGVYTRSLASSICRALRIESAPVLALLPHASVRTLDSVAEHKATRIKSAAAGSRGKFSPSARASTHVSRRAMGLVTVLVLAAAAVLLVPQGAFDRLRSALPAWSRAAAPNDSTAAETRKAAGSARVVEEIPMILSAEGTAQSVDTVGSNAAGPATPAGFPAMPQQATTATSARDAGAATVPAAPTAAPDRPAASGAGGLLTISAAAPAWIKIVDAKGAVLVQKTLAAGQVESIAEAATPLSVTVGRTDTTTVQVRGEAFDLVARARNNVARFEVK